jgi:PEP-CTERM motif
MKTIHLISAAAALIAASSAHAQSNAVTNGDFANGLIAWTVEGDVSTVGSANKRVSLTTASRDFQDDAPLPDGFNNNSGNAAIFFGDAPNLAGLDFTVLDAAADSTGNSFTYEGSAIRQNFFARAGDVLTVRFDWAFLSADTEQADFGFVAINNTVVNFVNAFSAPKASTFSGTFGDLNSVNWNWTTVDYAFTATTTGMVSLTLGVVDVNDVVGTSELRVDNIHVSAVPEPETWGLALAGLLIAGVAARRRV